ncbi:hypothetical protein DRE_02948 [Drechslerella stenobrocha 248]|uniref:Inositol polyphosphate-related phosphatase domain-containing protein n=1 Tax=Drechslerella stenobrocha 248 TaxID=1043628 RepID=W7I6E1_9PEZI|nr:hypothetical protein DRE_02948 [Drechslerella stenobrocha 248]
MAAPGTSDPGGSGSSRLEKLVGGPIAAALYKRRREFLRHEKCTVRVTAWNIAAVDNAHKDIAAVLQDSSAEPILVHREQRHGGAEGGGHKVREIAAGRIPGSRDGWEQEGKGVEEAQEAALPQRFTDIRDPATNEEGQGGPRPAPEDVSGTEIKVAGDENHQNPFDGSEPDERAPGPEGRKTDGESTGGQGVALKADRDVEPSSASQQGSIQVICLQEVVDVTAPGGFIRPVDEGVQKQWRGAIQAALPEYRCIVVEQLVGLLVFVFISPDIAAQITTPSGTTVGTGLLGYMGNKGGALGRIVLGGLPAAGISPPSLADSSYGDKEGEDEQGLRVVFVNCHLAAFPHAVDRRNWDYTEIQRRAYFHPKPLPISGGGMAPDAVAASHPNGYPFGECDLVIWAGDLNYRLDLSGDEIRKSLHRFLPPEIDGSDPPLKLSGNSDAPDTSDEASIGGDRNGNDRSFQGTIDYLLEYDQLRKQQQEGKAFQYFHEGKILFLPTYKYDFGTVSTFDSSEKARVPSFCDRVLWKDWKVQKEEIERLAARNLADSRDKKRELHLDGSGSMNDVLFDIGQDEADEVGDESDIKASEGPNTPQKQPEHEITAINDIDISDIATPLKLLKYFSHQTTVSSDHKPVIAEFSLEYLAVDQERRSQIQVEIVRELDRNENESRPAVTVIVDGDPDNETVDFGEVTWDQVVTRNVTIANTGRSPAECEFVTRPIMPPLPDDDEESGFTKISSSDASDPLAFGDESSVADGSEEEVCKNWVSVTFNSSRANQPHVLQPGEAESVVLQLVLPPKKNGRKPSSAYATLLRNLNTGKEELFDVLVMRVAQGQDKFISVKATFKPTFLGYSITELLRVPENAGGVRNNPKCNGEAHWSAPRELFRMTEFLLLTLKSIVLSEGGEGVRWTMLPGWPFVRDTWGLRDHGDGEDDDSTDELTPASAYARSALKRWIRDGIDCDRDWQWEEVDHKGYSEEDKCETMAECLLDWLAYLKEGVVPAALYGDVVKGIDGRSGADKILDLLSTAAPPVHANVFIYLTGFVSEVISLLSPKHDALAPGPNNLPSQPLSPAALVKRLSSSSRVTTTELVKRSILKEFSEVILARSIAGNFTECTNRSLEIMRFREDRPPNNVLLVQKEGVPFVTEAMITFAKHLISKYPATNIILEPLVAAELHSDLPFPVYTIPQKLSPHPDLNPYHLKTSLTVTFGGDGTILHAASLFSAAPVVPPLLSFSLGTLGFLGPWHFGDYKAAVEAVWSNNARVMRRRRIKVQVFDGPKELSGDLWPSHNQDGSDSDSSGTNFGVCAMNEVHIHRGRNPHMAVVDVFVDGRLLTEAVADGIILSTPTGSTAYSLSSFGSIVHPRVPAVLLTPICPRSLSFRPLVLPAEAEVVLRLSRKTRCKEVEVSIDGKRWGVVRPGVEVRVTGETRGTHGPGEGGVPCIWREGSEHEDEWVSGLNGLLKFNYPFGEEVEF